MRLFKQVGPTLEGDHWTANKADPSAFKDARLGRRFAELLRQHTSLACTTAGLPPGLTALKVWTRAAFNGTAALKRKINPTRVPIETKESVRWLDNLRHSIELVSGPFQ